MHPLLLLHQQQEGEINALYHYVLVIDSTAAFYARWHIILLCISKEVKAADDLHGLTEPHKHKSHHQVTLSLVDPLN